MLLQLLLLSITATVYGHDKYRFSIVNRLPTEVHILYRNPSSPNNFRSSYIPSNGGEWEEHYPKQGLSCVAVAVRVHVFVNGANVLQPHTQVLTLFDDQYWVTRLWLYDKNFSARVEQKTYGTRGRAVIGHEQVTKKFRRRKADLEEGMKWGNDPFWPHYYHSECASSFFQHLNKFLLLHPHSATLSAVDIINNSNTRIRAYCGRASADAATPSKAPLQEYVVEKGDTQTLSGLAEDEICGCEFSYITEDGYDVDVIVFVFGMYEIGVGPIKSIVFEKEGVDYVGIIGGKSARQFNFVAKSIGFHPEQITTMAAQRLIHRLLSRELGCISLELREAEKVQLSQQQRLRNLSMKRGLSLDKAWKILEPISREVLQLTSNLDAKFGEMKSMVVKSGSQEYSVPSREENGEMQELSRKICDLHASTRAVHEKQVGISSVIQDLEHNLLHQPPLRT